MLEDRKARTERVSRRLWEAGFIGALQGSLGGLVTGFYLNYRYNHGPNAGFFRAPYKIFYLVAWNIAGIIFVTDREKMKISKELAVEEEIRRSNYMKNELLEHRKT